MEHHRTVLANRIKEYRVFRLCSHLTKNLYCLRFKQAKAIGGLTFENASVGSQKSRHVKTFSGKYVTTNRYDCKMRAKPWITC